jgi:hypothetical protein
MGVSHRPHHQIVDVIVNRKGASHHPHHRIVDMIVKQIVRPDSGKIILMRGLKFTKKWITMLNLIGLRNQMALHYSMRYKVVRIPGLHVIR